jgi:hypothetical protein
MNVINIVNILESGSVDVVLFKVVEIPIEGENYSLK